MDPESEVLQISQWFKVLTAILQLSRVVSRRLDELDGTKRSAEANYFLIAG